MVEEREPDNEAALLATARKAVLTRLIDFAQDRPYANQLLPLAQTYAMLSGQGVPEQREAEAPWTEVDARREDDAFRADSQISVY